MPKEELKIAGRQSLVARANYSSGFTARVHLSDICTWYDTPTAVEHKLLLRRRLMLLRGLLRLHKGNVHGGVEQLHFWARVVWIWRSLWQTAEQTHEYRGRTYQPRRPYLVGASHTSTKRGAGSHRASAHKIKTRSRANVRYGFRESSSIQVIQAQDQSKCNINDDWRYVDRRINNNQMGTCLVLTTPSQSSLPAIDNYFM